MLLAKGLSLQFRFPGPVTGKLSDVAGCFVLPLFLSALLALFTRTPAALRLGLGTVLTVVFFSALKLSQPFANVTCGAMNVVARPFGSSCGRILADPSDLLALPFAVLAAWFGLHRIESTAPESVTRETP